MAAQDMRSGFDGEPDINGRRGMILVFHFGFGQGGLIDGTPQDRFQALIDSTFFNEFAEFPNDGGLVILVQREIGMIPIPQHT